jgi:hypothetical protein
MVFLISFICLFELVLNSFSYLFISYLSSDTGLCVSSLSSLIILTIIFWNSVFDIYPSLVLFRSLIMSWLERELLPWCFMFLHWVLCIWNCFWLKVSIPVPQVGVLWTIIQDCIELWYIFLSLNGEDGGSLVILSVSCTQDTGFYPLFHTGQGGLTTKTVTVFKTAALKLQ